jgi:hypothetical protein
VQQMVASIKPGYIEELNNKYTGYNKKHQNRSLLTLQPNIVKQPWWTNWRCKANLLSHGTK